VRSAFLADLVLEISASSDEDLDAVASVVGPLAAGDQRPGAIEVIVGRDVFVPPERPPDHLDDARSLWVDDVVATVSHIGGVHATATASRIVVWAQPGAAVQRPFRQVLPVALGHAAHHHGRFVVHAGAFLAGGRAVLVLGGPGQGKSTLVAGAASCGLPVAADDLVVLRAGPSGPELAGVPRPVALPPELGRGEAPIPDDPRGRVFAPHISLAAGWWPVGGVVVADHGSGADARVEPLASTEVTRLVLAGLLAVGAPAATRAFLPVAARAGGRGWTVHHAGMAERRLEAAAMAVGAVVAQLGVC
jgi:hypothetical protein